MMICRDPVKREVQTFAEINVAWLSRLCYHAASVVRAKDSELRARGIFAGHRRRPAYGEEPFGYRASTMH